MASYLEKKLQVFSKQSAMGLKVLSKREIYEFTDRGAS